MAYFRVTYQPRPHRDRVKNLADEVRALTRKYAEEVRRLYELTTETWTHDPDFPITDVSEGGDYILNVAPGGSPDSVRIFRYVDEGTSVRYRVMSRDFVPKTQKRIIGSGPGRGYAAGFSFENPMPGIEAREFTKEIAEQLQERFVKDLTDLLRKI